MPFTKRQGEKSVAAGCLFGVLALALIVGSVALAAFLVMLSWNLVMPPVFGVASVTFWQSLALLFLLSILGSILGAFTKCR